MKLQEEFQKLDKKSAFYLAIVLVVFLLALFLISYYSEKTEIPVQPFVGISIGEETKIKKQLRELELLKREVATPTEEELKKQALELEVLKRDVPPLSEQEIQKQMEELENLKR